MNSIRITCRAVTPVNVIGGFRRAGVYPLDPTLTVNVDSGVCNPPGAVESEASSTNDTTAASVSNVETTPVPTMPSAAHTDLNDSSNVPASSATNTHSTSLSLENLSAEDLERFERRYNEGSIYLILSTRHG